MWIAHYIAGLMLKAERAALPKKSKIEAECFKTILLLWKHRSNLPENRRPFRELEPILTTLERLNPDIPIPYYLAISQDQKPKPQPGSVQDWMLFAEIIDDTARFWIREAFLNALQKASTKSVKAYLKNALEIPGLQDTHVMMRALSEVEPKENAKDLRRRRIQKSIEDLQKLSLLCTKLLVHSSKEIRNLEKGTKKN